jgi:Fic family protein
VRIAGLFTRDRERIAAESDRTGSSLRIHDLLQLHPFVTANDLVARTGLSAPTVNAALADLERLGIVAEIMGRRRGAFSAIALMWIFFSEGTAPLRG